MQQLIGNLEQQKHGNIYSHLFSSWAMVVSICLLNASALVPAVVTLPKLSFEG